MRIRWTCKIFLVERREMSGDIHFNFARRRLYLKEATNRHCSSRKIASSILFIHWRPWRHGINLRFLYGVSGVARGWNR